MRVALERLDGVESVTVSLEDGEAVIRFAEQHEVTLAIVRQIVRDNGFSPKETELRAAGTTVALPGGELGVELNDVSYRLELRSGGEGPDRNDLAPGLRVVVSGVVPEPQDGRQPAIEVSALTVIDRVDSLGLRSEYAAQMTPRPSVGGSPHRARAARVTGSHASASFRWNVRCATP